MCACLRSCLWFFENSHFLTVRKKNHDCYQPGETVFAYTFFAFAFHGYVIISTCNIIIRVRDFIGKRSIDTFPCICFNGYNNFSIFRYFGIESLNLLSRSSNTQRIRTLLIIWTFFVWFYNHYGRLGLKLWMRSQ